MKFLSIIKTRAYCNLVYNNI